MPELTIQIVGWNSAEALPMALGALAAIPGEAAVVRYIDNNSQDDSVAIVRRILPQADIVELKENTGFGGGHNVGFQMCETPFILIHNPDLIISWPGIQKLLHIFRDDEIGAVQGKLYRNDEQTIFDSTGIILTRSLNGIDRGAGEIDQGQYETRSAIVAPTGACAIYRMEALRSVAHSETEFFDRDFFAYKEDVDLGWRLNRAGWRVVYEPVRMGIHRRHLQARSTAAWLRAPAEVYRRLRSQRTYYSLRNWLWMIAKNVRGKQLLLAVPFISLRSLQWLMLSVFYPPLFAAWAAALGRLPDMIKKHSQHA